MTGALVLAIGSVTACVGMYTVCALGNPSLSIGSGLHKSQSLQCNPM
jgi:hypothetical protein